MHDSLSDDADAAKRFYQRSFTRMKAQGIADDFTQGAAIRAGTHRYSAAFEHLVAKPGQTVLEMGYGGNGVIDLLAPLSAEYHVVDIVDRSSGRKLPPNVRAHLANLDNAFPFEDRSFDTVIAMMVIEHLYDPFHAFAEAARVTRPGGDLFINLPNIASIKCRMQLLAGRMPVTSGPGWFEAREWDGNHLHYFTIGDVKRLGQVSGLEFVGVAPVGQMIAVKRLRPSLLCHELTYRFCKRTRN